MVDWGLAHWHQREPEEFAAARSALRESYPTLRVEADALGERLTGTFVVRDRDDGCIAAKYKVRINLPSEFPQALPSIRETGGMIPRTTERHVDPGGNLCVLVPEEFWTTHDRCDLVEYLNGPVRHFFLSQLSFERFGEWPYGERRHGREGWLDFYEEILGTRDIPTIKALLGRLSVPRIEWHWLCPCGSKRKLRNCHGGYLAKLSARAAVGFAERALAQFRELESH